MGTTSSSPAVGGGKHHQGQVVPAVAQGGVVTTSSSSPLDPLPHLSSDLPRHIVETALPPGSGRMMRGYRLRSADHGALIVCKATVVRIDPGAAGSPATTPGQDGTGAESSGEGASSSSSRHARRARRRRRNLSAAEEIAMHASELARLRQLVGDASTHPHVLPYQRWIASSHPLRDARTGITHQPLYLLRQHCHATLSDRLATRPFLTRIEKMWITYQLLRALDSIHTVGVCHGNLTAENVCVTSWNWVVITDLASYRPTRIPDDDPSDFIQHFQKQDGVGAGSGKCCYLAPERFFTTGRSRSSSPSGGEAVAATTNATHSDGDDLLDDRLTPEMDIFSAGCVLIETFLNGERALDLGDLMEYRRTNGKSDALRQKLNKIESSSVRAACKHMLSLDPADRLSASAYLERLSSPPSSSSSGRGAGGRRREAAIPPHFESFLWPMFRRLRSEVLCPDGRIALAAACYRDAIRTLIGGGGPEATLGIAAEKYRNDDLLDDDDDDGGYFDKIAGGTASRPGRAHVPTAAAKGEGEGEESSGAPRSRPPSSSRPPPSAAAVPSTEDLLAETEDVLRRLEWLEKGTNPPPPDGDSIGERPDGTTAPDNDGGGTALPAAPEGTDEPTSRPSSSPAATSSSSLIIFLQLVLSSIRHVQRPSSKLVALQLLLRLSRHCTDEARLQRIVPHVVTLLDDSSAPVRATAVRTLSIVLARVKSFGPSDVSVFPRYVFKRVAPLVRDDQLVVRVAFAESLALLAETSLRFLDVGHAMRLHEAVGGTGGGGGGGGGGGPGSWSDPSADDAGDGGATTASSSADTSLFSDDVAKLLDGGGEGGTMTTKTKTGTAVSTAGTTAAKEGEPPSSAIGAAGGRQMKSARAKAKDRSLSSSPSPAAATEQATTLVPNTYDADLAALQETVAGFVVQITTDPSRNSSPSKRALLSDLARLCSFFGRDGVTAQILPQVLAFLNVRDDWELRAALCRNLPAACATCGRVATEQFVVPCVETALVDGEEGVTNAALTCLGSLVSMGLLTRSMLLGSSNGGGGTRAVVGGDYSVANAPASALTPTLGAADGGAQSPSPSPAASVGVQGGMGGILPRYAPLLLHPSDGVRRGMTSLVCATCRAVGHPDDEVFVLPILRPFLRYEPTSAQVRDVDGLTRCLLPPVSRRGFEAKLRQLAGERLDMHRQQQQSSSAVGGDEMWTSVKIAEVNDEVDDDVAGTAMAAAATTEEPSTMMEESVFGDILKDLVVDYPGDDEDAPSVTNADAGSSLSPMFFATGGGGGGGGARRAIVEGRPSPSEVLQRAAAGAEMTATSSRPTLAGNEPITRTSTEEIESGGRRTGEDEDARLSSMMGYLILASAHRQQSTNNNGNNSSGVDLRESLMMKDETGMSVVPNMSMSYSFMVPSQKFVELLADPLPEWYDALRETSRRDRESGSSGTLCPEWSAFRSISSIAHVYALGMTYPSKDGAKLTNGMVPIGDSNTLKELEDLMGKDTESSSADTFRRSILSNDESRAMEAAKEGVWGSVASLDPSLVDVNLTVGKLKCLDVPPLPPRLGVLREADGRAFSWHGPVASVSEATVTAEATAGAATASPRSEWRPRVDALVLSSSETSEHTGAVSKLAVSQDQSFFASASHDGTCRVWELRQMEEAVDLQSCLTYSGHISSNIEGLRHPSSVRLNDVCIVENSHSVASAASNGTVHIWRVDMVSSKGKTTTAHGDATTGPGPQQTGGGRHYYDTSRVSGSTLIRNVDPREGEVLSVSHFNTASSSVVTFATQGGCVHSWDLRCAREPFALDLRPELGYLTSAAVGVDRNWIVAGTHRGYVALWDLRYQMMVKLWRHSSCSSVSRLATCFTTLPQDKVGVGRSGGEAEPRPYIFAGCGLNEASVFDLSTGSCRQCFRVLDPAYNYTDQSALPTSCLSMPELQEVPLPRNSQSPIRSAVDVATNSVLDRIAPPEPKMLSLIGRMGTSGNQYLITGGSDRCLRYWDFTSPSRCYTISGLMHGQPRPIYERAASAGKSSSQQLFLCRQLPTPGIGEVENSRVPWRLQQGPVRPENCHRGAILDLKNVDFPVKGLLSCSQDGVIKLWR